MSYPKKNLDLSGLSMCISKRINWIISEVQVSEIFFFIFLASKQLPAALGSGIGTGSIFAFHFHFRTMCLRIVLFLQNRIENTFRIAELSGIGYI